MNVNTTSNNLLPIKLTPATHNDLTLLNSIFNDSNNLIYSGDYPYQLIDHIQDDFNKKNQIIKETYFLIQSGTKSNNVGDLKMRIINVYNDNIHRSQKKIFIDKLGFSSACQHAGYTQFLFDEIKKYANNLGINEIHWDCSKSNHSSVTICKQLLNVNISQQDNKKSIDDYIHFIL